MIHKTGFHAALSLRRDREEIFLPISLTMRLLSENAYI